MKITHKISETKAGMLGGTAFLVSIRADVSTDEKIILDKFGANSAFEIDAERFRDVKGANSGYLNLSNFTSGAEFKLPNIQQASDFLDQVVAGLQRVKSQIDATSRCADKLDQEFTQEL